MIVFIANAQGVDFSQLHVEAGRNICGSLRAVDGVATGGRRGGGARVYKGLRAYILAAAGKQPRTVFGERTADRSVGVKGGICGLSRDIGIAGVERGVIAEESERAVELIAAGFREDLDAA